MKRKLYLLMMILLYVPIIPLITYIEFIGSVIMFLLFLGKYRYKWVQFNGRVLCSWAFFLSGVKLQVEGREHLKRGNNCYIANHASIGDILVLVQILPQPFGFIAKKELTRVPFVHYWLGILHCVMLTRKNIKSNIKAMDKGVQQIKNGISMLIFPEGTRSKTGTVNEFHKGSFKLAIRSDANVVPIAIKGIRDTYEDRKKFIGRYTVKIKIFEPITFENLSNEEKDQKIKIVEENIKNAVETM